MDIQTVTFYLQNLYTLHKGLSKNLENLENMDEILSDPKPIYEYAMCVESVMNKLLKLGVIEEEEDEDEDDEDEEDEDDEDDEDDEHE
jgi:hypothetical protein